MKQMEEEIKKVEEALIRFHRRPVEPQIGPFWEARLMARIRAEKMDGRRSAPNSASPIIGTVWRFAAATCLVAVVLAVYASGLSIESQYQVAELILDDPSGLDFAMLFASL